MPGSGRTKAVLFVVVAVVVILFLAGLIGGAIGRALNIGSPDILHVPVLEIHEFFKGDVLTHIGSFPITNTLIASWLTIIVVAIFAFAATRKMRIVPKRLQGVVEVAVETLLNFVVSIAGEKNGRKFFPIIATIFIFVMFNAYFALMPFFGPGITVTEHGEAIVENDSTVTEVMIHGEEIKSELTGTVAHVEVEEGDAVEKGDVIYLLEDGEEIEAEEAGIILHLELAEGASVEENGVAYTISGHIEKDGVLYKLANGEEVKAEIGGRFTHLELKEVGDPVTTHEVLATIESKPPLLRSANTDVNMTLALAIVAVFCIEFWGLRSRGFRHYIVEYVNLGELSRAFKLLFTGKIKDVPMAILMGVINAFMGFIEMLSHSIRMISFTFRLFGNMTAGEILLLSATFLIPWILAIPFYGLELLVGFIQALIFGGLTLVWATMAAEHASEEH